jgi:preprotein translocase subunit SecF
MGLTLIKPNINIDFIGKRRIAFVVSILVIVLGLGSLLLKGGPKYGIDFAGGVMVQVRFVEAMEPDDIRESLAGQNLTGLAVQSLGLAGDNEFLIRTSSELPPDVVHTQVDESLAAALGAGAYEIQRLEMVGPKVSADLRTKAVEALFYAVLLIAIYISGRFEHRWWTAAVMAAALSAAMYLLGFLSLPMGILTLVALALALVLCWRLKLNYALGAVVALIHDVLITVGIFSLLDKEFDLSIVAALLTIIGYSLNDTIIVFDRIRENIREKIRAKISDSFGITINASINQTLSRTILTSGTTLIVVLSLYFLGGGVIHDFALALLIGIIVGTYSSIFVASPILLAFVPSMETGEEEEEAKS